MNFQLDLFNPGHQSCNHSVYGLTCSEYEKLLRRANGHCEMCGKPGFLSARGKLHIDHDHALGWRAVRGLLCNHCNTQFRRPWMDEAKRQAYLCKAWHRTNEQRNDLSPGDSVRDYANIITAIWRDPTFVALDGGPQRTYLMLITQADISGAGTLPLTIRRWAKYAANTTPQHVTYDLAVLEEAQFVYVDDDTEELLVRSFAKYDKGYNNPKRRPVIIEAAKALQSLKLRRVLWTELARLGADGFPELTETLMDSLSDSHSQPSVTTPVERPVPTPSEAIDGTKYAQGNRLSDSDTPSDRVVVTVVSKIPQPLNHKPLPLAAPARERDEPPPIDEPAGSAEKIITGWISGLRRQPQRRIVNDIGKHVREALADGQDPADIAEALRLWQTKTLGPSALPSLIHQVTNSQPSNVVALPTIRASPDARPSTSDARYQAGLALAARFEAQDVADESR